MRRRWLSIWFTLLSLALLSTASAQVPDRPDLDEHVRPILESLCYDCHGHGSAEGNVQFDKFESNQDLIADRELWGRAWENLLTETMPPGDMPQPTRAERKTLSRWIGQTVFQLEPGKEDPGQVTIRRLNRVEYGYSVYDLLGVEFPVADHFPADDTGYGFDTIGDVLTVPPTLMDKYFVAAARISEKILEETNNSSKEHSTVLKQVFGSDSRPDDPAKQLARARHIVQGLATRAYRQPVNKDTVEKLLSLTKPGFDAGRISYEEMVCRAIEAILVSPRFIYRAEFQPSADDPRSIHPLDEYSLASRLSYFLWSSLPDQELLGLAEQGELRAELKSQVKRMIKDPKSDRLIENFVGQWLQIRDVEGLYRSRKYEKIVRKARHSMRYETDALFRHIMRGNRSTIELLNADYTFLNEELAKFYGIPGVIGDKIRRVELPAGGIRGGILTHASVLMVTSNPDRTSPVKRGLFILDNILGTPAPPAPPDVPALEEPTENQKPVSFRVLLERHRADPVCASCHDRMDPLGLGLENFDAIGLWREQEEGQPIDASSRLASGESFNGIRELREILTQKRRLFYRCLTKKMMTYALGRGIDYTDIPRVESIVQAMLDNDGRFYTMLMGIIESPQFQSRRGYNRTVDTTSASSPANE